MEKTVVHLCCISQSCKVTKIKINAKLQSCTICTSTLKPVSRQLFEGGGGRFGTVGGRSPEASFGFYLREVFQSQTNTEKILYNRSH